MHDNQTRHYIPSELEMDQEICKTPPAAHVILIAAKNKKDLESKNPSNIIKSQDMWYCTLISSLNSANKRGGLMHGSHTDTFLIILRPPNFTFHSQSK